MKLRLIENRRKRLLLCPNGSIMEVDEDLLSRLLTEFNRPSSFKGNSGYWNIENASIEDVYGETLAFVDDANKLVIISNKLFNVEKRINYISATQYAELHGKSRPSVKNMCAAGRIEGAYKTSSGWLIPADAPYPKRKSKNMQTILSV